LLCYKTQQKPVNHRGIFMRQFASTALVAFVALVSSQFQVAQAAPVTLEWVTTASSTGTVGQFGDSTGVVSTRESTSAGVEASFVLADESLLRNSTLQFNHSGIFGPNNTITAARLQTLEPFAGGQMRNDPQIDPNNAPLYYGFPNLCSIRTNTGTAQGSRCAVSITLTRDAANAGRYFGQLDFASSSASVTMGGNASETGALFWSGGASRSPNSLAISGYWQVQGAGSVPLPGGLALVTLGLVCMLARKSKTN
jgi:hypothetical protein